MLCRHLPGKPAISPFPEMLAPPECIENPETVKGKACLKIDLHLQGIEKFVEGGKKLHDAEGLYDLSIRGS